MTRRRILACFLLLLSTAAALAQSKQASKTTYDPDKKEWIQLFNGKDLKDWAPKITGYDLNDNFGNTFRARRRLYLAAKREPPRRIPQSRAAQPGRLHGSEGVELQVVFRQSRQLEMPVHKEKVTYLFPVSAGSGLRS
jgi:hypothetical protein